MVPTALVLLESLPLTVNGKVDRKSLPKPQVETAYSTPRSPTERAIAKIWEQLLGTEKIGIEDNFYELGGHSLLATQVASRIRASFQLELPLRSLFKSPTVASLAEYIETIKWASDACQKPPADPCDEVAV
jgi:acyl carrier protein